jgi:hypothetical protein
MYRILVVYHYPQYSIRNTTWDHLYCFRNHGSHRCDYLNLATHSLPERLHDVPYDLIVFDTTFLSARWSRDYFPRLLDKVMPLRQNGAVKVAIPQDEFIHTDLLCDFINALGIECVFSVAPESEWPKIYDIVDRAKVRFHHVLTGYLEERSIRQARRLGAYRPVRDLDLGYRANAYYCYGRHGMMKIWLADEVQKRAAALGLATDIATNSGHKLERWLKGDQWYKFLLRCRCTFGIEGGTSILDRDGAIWKRTHAYLGAHPDAEYAEVERNCFPNLDGSFNLVALSPRHLEACLTRTCQLLVEGDYNGVLKPGRHYMPLKTDLSNLVDVLELIKDERVCQQYTELAYEEIVASDRYSYKTFVPFLIAKALTGRPPRQTHYQPRDRALQFAMRLNDARSWYRLMDSKDRPRLGRLVDNRITRKIAGLLWRTVC